MSIAKKDVEYVARLARLRIPENQIKRFTSQLADIISYVDKLKEVDITDIPPTSHPLPLKNVFREDTVKQSLKAPEALSNAPQKKDGSFKVPCVIE
jgi:aspartyl-tRNA(Asn)/glutamyl-tRNA(Gln) amidotransferase subunit C